MVSIAIHYHNAFLGKAGPYRRALRHASLSAMAAMLAAAPAYAQNQGGGEARAAGDRGGIAEIVVTARKRAENLQDTPIAVTAATGEDLKARSITQVNELAALVPGMSMNMNQAASMSVTFNIRAQNQQDLIVALDPPVGVYSDGVFLNSAIGVMGNSVVDLERIEVLKGPQGTLYGRNTTGGAVNFYTRQPTDQWEGELTAGAGSFNGYEVSGVLNAPLGGGNALRLVGEARGHSGFGRNLFTGNRLADRKSRLIRGALKLAPAEDFTAIIRADYSEARSDGGPIWSPIAINPASSAARQIAYAQGFAPVGTNPLTPAQRTAVVNYWNSFVGQPGSPYVTNFNGPSFAKVTAWGISGTLEYDLGSAQIKSITAYRDIDDRKAADTDGSPQNIFELLKFRTTIKQFTEELQLNGDTFDNNLHYTLGAYYIHSVGHDINTSRSFPLVAPAPSNTNGEVTVESVALFGQATYDILDNLHLTGGLRYTDEKRTLVSANTAGPTLTCSTPPSPGSSVIPGVGGAPCRATFPYKENNLSYTAGLDWNVTPDIMLYAKTGRGYKSGGVNERLSANPTSATPFKTEQVTDYEVGLKSEFFDRRLRINADYYRSYYNNIQRTVVILDPTGRPVSAIQNAAKAIIEGVEIEATAKPVNELTLAGTLGYTDPRYKRYINPGTGADLSGQNFNQVSKWTYTLSGAYELPTTFGSVGARLDWIYRSSRDLYAFDNRPDITVQPGFGLLNGQLQAKIESADVDARFFVKNILEKQYYQTYFSLFTTVGHVVASPGEPRTWGVSVTKHF